VASNSWPESLPTTFEKRLIRWAMVVGFCPAGWRRREPASADVLLSGFASHSPFIPLRRAPITTNLLRFW